MSELGHSGEAAPATNRWHLGRSEEEAELAAFEFSLERLLHTYYRWKSECLAAVTDGRFSGTDAAVLNVIRMKDRAKGLTEICRILNRDDTPNMQYAIRKLLKSGLIEKTTAASRKGTSYRATDRGREVTDAYADLRATVLMSLTRTIGDRAEGFAAAEQVLTLMSGLYDQAAKLASERRYREHALDEPL